MAEDAGEERAKWLGDRLPDTFKNLEKEIKDLEKRMKDLEKEIKEKDDIIDNKIKEMGRPETYPEGVSDEEVLEVWRERFKESRKEHEKQNERREELEHLKEKHREELSRLEMLITEEKDRSTSLNSTNPEGDLKDTEETNSQETNSNTEKGGDDQ